RAVIVSVGIDEMTWVRVSPNGLASVGREALNDFLIADSMVEHQQIASNRWPTVARTGFQVPYHCRATGGPAVQQVGLARNSVGPRTKKLRPILSPRPSNGGTQRHQEEQQGRAKAPANSKIRLTLTPRSPSPSDGEGARGRGDTRVRSQSLRRNPTFSNK